jgi:flagellar basal-body rod modification protein FlgD
MDINNINSLTSQVFNQRDSANKNKLGQQEFLHLLVTQMRNQDPMNPLDGAEFASQLAQFNTVEQLIGVNDELKILKNSQDLMSMSMINSMATSLTGKNVRALSDQVQLAAGGSANILYELNNSAEEVEIIIRNSAGDEVRRESLSGLPSGTNSWEWDGKNSEGRDTAEGQYTVEIVAKNGSSKVGSLIFTEGIVEKVRFQADGVFIMVNGIPVPISDVQEVSSVNKP